MLFSIKNTILVLCQALLTAQSYDWPCSCHRSRAHSDAMHDQLTQAWTGKRPEVLAWQCLPAQSDKAATFSPARAAGTVLLVGAGAGTSATAGTGTGATAGELAGASRGVACRGVKAGSASGTAASADLRLDLLAYILGAQRSLVFF